MKRGLKLLNNYKKNCQVTQLHTKRLSSTILTKQQQTTTLKQTTIPNNEER